jgi:hypothetical protein
MPSNITATPNGLVPFDVFTSFNSGLFAADNALHGGGEAGYGALKARSVATNVVLYEPFRYRMDTRIQLAAKFEVVDSVVHEWYETDRYLPDTSANTGTMSAAGGAGQSATFNVTAGTGKYFRAGDKVRYVATGGTSWQYARVASVSTDTLTLKPLDSTVTLPASAANAKIEILESLRGSDLNFAVQPINNIGQMYSTYIQKSVYDMAWTPRSKNEANIIDMLAEQEEKLFDRMRRGRSLSYLYGTKGKIALAASEGGDVGDIVYSSPGIYDIVSGFNKQTSEMTTTGAFDAAKFKKALYTFIEHNFGGESGGPERRDMFINGLFGSYLGQAFEDKQRFYSNEFVGGVKTSRFEHNGLGIIDFTWEPIMDYKHPRPDGSLRDGSNPKAVGLMVPIETCVTRLTMINEGPSSQTFQKEGGDEVMYTRVKSTEGQKLTLKQYCGVLEEQ